MTRPSRFRIFLPVLLLPPTALLLSLYLVPLPSMKPYSSVVLDRHREFVHGFIARDGIWRLRTSSDEIPEQLKRLLIEKEDRYFYYHPGINPISIMRAVGQNIFAGRRVSGASTITMQVARMLEGRERTYQNKMVEMFRALQLEARYSKNEILEMYLSIVPLGGNLEGLKSASLMYYDAPLERLNIAQLFDLILIPNDPNGLRPDRNADRLYNERITQARRWIHDRFLSREDSMTIATAPAAASRRELPRRAQHFSLRIHSMVPHDAEVISTLDLPTQHTLERLMMNHLRSWQPRGVMNGAAIIVDNKSHEIRAYVGSGDFEDDAAAGQVDAANSLRSPGSTLKPLLYAHAIDNGVLAPETRVLDTPYDIEGFSVENYDGTYSGYVSAAEALRRSLNIPMIRLLRSSGFSSFVEFAGRAGIASLEEQKERLGLSVILGGCGVTLEEMVGAYSIFPSGGRYVRPQFIRKADTSPRVGEEVCTPAAAYIVTDILSSVNRPDLPNNFESSLNLPKVAFKTGTSYGRRDAWAIGYTAQYTVGVWMGNVTNKGNPDLVGGRAAAPLLVDILNSISSRFEKEILPKPPDLGVREVCARSGDLATSLCDVVIDDYYSTSRSSSVPCKLHREFMIAMNGETHYCPMCVGSQSYFLRTFVDYPPDLLAFWKKIDQPFTAPPPHYHSCTLVNSTSGPTIVSPTDNMTYFLVSQQQKIALQATTPLDIRTCTWYINDRYYGQQGVGQKLLASLGSGRNTILCLDDRGRSTTVTVHVKQLWQ